ncbi:MAG: hypothetical protein IT365_15295 [Candidatus Hydrogenedentes bacterium]|nr:hypothetical protein [Candidatus Hydrogenedentota bacterium]
MRYLRKCTTVGVIIAAAGCATSVGNSKSGYEEVKRAKIQPSEAAELAQPFLDQTFELRKADSELSRDGRGDPAIWVTLDGGHYYVVKENYPFIKASAHLHHAVKVHKNTGKVIPPK